MYRVEFKTDAKNDRARAALAAIPSEFEGIHRKHMVVRDGERRDSAWYAVIDDDWPQVKARARAEDRGRRIDFCAARYPLRDWSDRNEQRQRDRTRPRRLGRRRPPAGAGRRAARGRGARPPLRARPGDRRGRRRDRARARGSRTSPARRRWPRSTRTSGASPSTRCRRSRSSAGPSSSTAPGRRSPPRPTRPAERAVSSPRRSACARSTSTTRHARSTTRARRSRRTTSSRSSAPPRASSRTPARRPRRSSR